MNRGLTGIAAVFMAGLLTLSAARVASGELPVDPGGMSAAERPGQGQDPARPAEAAEPEGVDAQPLQAADDFEGQKLLSDTDVRTTTTAPMPSYMETLKVVGSLGLILVLVVVAAWGFRRLAPRASGAFSSSVLQVLARTHVAPKQTICLVKVPGKLLVVGATQQALSALAEISDPEQVERVLAMFEKSSTKSATSAFKELLTGVAGPKGDSRASDGLSETVESVSERVALLSSKLESYDSDRG